MNWVIWLLNQAKPKTRHKRQKWPGDTGSRLASRPGGTQAFAEMVIAWFSSLKAERQRCSCAATATERKRLAR